MTRPLQSFARKNWLTGLTRKVRQWVSSSEVVQVLITSLIGRDDDLKECFRSSLRGARGNGTKYHSPLALRGQKTALRYLRKLCYRIDKNYKDFISMKKEKLTTISVTVKARGVIKDEATKRGMTQSEFVTYLVKEHMRRAKLKKKQKDKLRLEDMTEEEILAFIAKSLEHLSSRNDVSKLISFIRKQEQEILTPIQTDMAQIKNSFSQLMTIFQGL